MIGPEHDPTDRIAVYRPRHDETRLFQFLGVADVRRKIQIEWGAILNLRIKVPGRTQGQLHMVSCRLLILDYDVFDCEVQIRGSGDCDLFGKGVRRKRELTTYA